VCDVARDGARVAVAVLIDTCDTQGNAAELSVFAPRGGEDVLAVVLEWAEAMSARGGRDQLDLPAWPGGGLDEVWIAARGYRVGFVMHEMLRPADALAPPPVRAPLPAGWTWRSLGAELLDSYYEVVRASFAELPGAFVSARDSFARRALTDPLPVQLLCEPGEPASVAAWVRVQAGPGTGGELASLGRHPRHRGLGLGDHLVSRGLAMLGELGARRSILEVAAVNARVIELYQRHGYRQQSSVPVYRRPIRRATGA
jgi:ribosomal protein S18 acetylase RimI-like enzyme